MENLFVAKQVLSNESQVIPRVQVLTEKNINQPTPRFVGN